MKAIQLTSIFTGAVIVSAPCGAQTASPDSVPLSQSEIQEYRLTAPQARPSVNDSPSSSPYQSQPFSTQSYPGGSPPQYQNDPYQNHPAVPYVGDYKGLTVHLSQGTFYYIRLDHLQQLPGGLSAIKDIAKYGVFGPFPSESTVNVRKGTSYYVVWSCSNQIKYNLVAIADNGYGQDLTMPCH